MKKNLLCNLAALLFLFSCAENTSSGVNATNELYEKKANDLYGDIDI